MREKTKDILTTILWCVVVTAVIAGIVLLSCWLETVLIKEVPYNVRHLWYGDSLIHFFRFNHIMNTIVGGLIAVLADLTIIFRLG